MRIAVVYGGWSPEAAISEKSAIAVAAALKRLGYDVYQLPLTRDIAVELLELNPQLVFPILHGKPGEDGSFQGLLEILGIPYVGENIKVSALCMDKDFTKRLLKGAGINVPPGEVIREEKDLKGLENWSDFPAVVKPAQGGSSIGLKVVEDKKHLVKSVKNLFQKGEKVLVERFIPGREFSCGKTAGKILPPIEIVPKKGLYDFETKYTAGAASFHPVEEEPLKGLIEATTLKIVETLEIEHLCRVDYRYDPYKEKLFVLEVNTIPGMTETSLLPRMAKLDGIGFEELIEILISSKSS